MNESFTCDACGIEPGPGEIFIECEICKESFCRECWKDEGRESLGEDIDICERCVEWGDSLIKGKT